MDFESLYLTAFLKISELIMTPYFQAGAAIVAILIFFVLFGSVRKHYFHMTMKGANFGFVMGVITVLVIEILAGVGFVYKSKIIALLSGKKDETSIMGLAQERFSQFNNVLGVSTCESSPVISITPSATYLLEQLPYLSAAEQQKVEKILCR